MEAEVDDAGMDCFRGDGPPAYNPPIHKSNASRSLIDSINKLIPPINSLCLICEIVGREKDKDIITVLDCTNRYCNDLG